LLETLAARHVLVLSAPILEEVERVLSYPRLVKASKLQPEQVTEFLEFLSSSSYLADIDDTLPVPIRDPKDRHVLQTAVAGKAEVLCTLDAHFFELPVLDYCAATGIQVFNDLDLLRLIRAAPEPE
jgi:putative PIN family toxin of toxin-antitoxin system